MPLHDLDQEELYFAKPYVYTDVSDIASALLSHANRGNREVCEWLDKIIRRGASIALLKEIEEAANTMILRYRIELDRKTRSFKAVPEKGQYGGHGVASPVYALWLTQIVNYGTIDRFKRCAQKECRRYFYGDPRKQWCSDNCGSKHRVRKKRKLDKERQML